MCRKNNQIKEVESTIHRILLDSKTYVYLNQHNLEIFIF